MLSLLVRATPLLKHVYLNSNFQHMRKLAISISNKNVDHLSYKYHQTKSLTNTNKFVVNCFRPFFLL